MLITGIQNSSIISIIKLVNESKKSDQFERDVAEWLNTNYSHEYDVTFEVKGGSDSTVSDIRIISNRLNDRWIECKLAKAQGAHVTLDQKVTDDGTIEYSYSGSATDDAKDAIQTMVNYLNSESKSGNISKSHPYIRFGERAKNSGDKTNAVTISLDGEDVQIAFDRIIAAHYRMKNVDFVIAGTSKSDLKIFKLDTFTDAFNIDAIFRVLPSGSHNVSKVRVKEVIQSLKEIPECEDFKFYTGEDNAAGLVEVDVDSDGDLVMNKVKIHKDKLSKCLYAQTDNPPVERMQLGQYYYIFQEPVGGYSKIRRTSYNPNDDKQKPSINFSLNLKSDIKDDAGAFKKYLEEQCGKLNISDKPAKKTRKSK